MSLLDLYKQSNKNIRTVNYTGGSQFSRDTSKLNIDFVPLKYNRLGKLINSNSKTSRLDLDILPSRYSPK